MTRARGQSIPTPRRPRALDDARAETLAADLEAARASGDVEAVLGMAMLRESDDIHRRHVAEHRRGESLIED